MIPACSSCDGRIQSQISRRCEGERGEMRFYTAADRLRLSGGGSRSMFGRLQHGKQGRFSMAAAGQPKADFPGDDLRRTARKSEEADRTRPLLALPASLDGVRFRAGGAAALVTRGEPGRERLAVHPGHLAFGRGIADSWPCGGCEGDLPPCLMRGEPRRGALQGRRRGGPGDPRRTRSGTSGRSSGTPGFRPSFSRPATTSQITAARPGTPSGISQGAPSQSEGAKGPIGGGGEQ